MLEVGLTEPFSVSDLSILDDQDSSSRGVRAVALGEEFVDSDVGPAVRLLRTPR